MNSFLDGTAWHSGRTCSVLVFVINNKSQFLLFLQAGPMREEKSNEMWLLPSGKSEFAERETQTTNTGPCVVQLMYSDGVGMKVQGCSSNREGRDSQHTQHGDICSYPRFSISI